MYGESVLRAVRGIPPQRKRTGWGHGMLFTWDAVPYMVFFYVLFLLLGMWMLFCHSATTQE